MAHYLEIARGGVEGQEGWSRRGRFARVASGHGHYEKEGRNGLRETDKIFHKMHMDYMFDKVLW